MLGLRAPSVSVLLNFPFTAEESDAALVSESRVVDARPATVGVAGAPLAVSRMEGLRNPRAQTRARFKALRKVRSRVIRLPPTCGDV